MADGVIIEAIVAQARFAGLCGSLAVTGMSCRLIGVARPDDRRRELSLRDFAKRRPDTIIALFGIGFEQRCITRREHARKSSRLSRTGVPNLSFGLTNDRH